VTQNRWWTLAALGALAVVGMYTAVRSATGVDACGNPGVCVSSCAAPACCASDAKPTQDPPPKQHFRFVLDNLNFRMGSEGECKIKRIEFEYKGDGIEADVAKAALGAGNAESSATKAELGELTKLLEKLLEAQTGQKLGKPTCGMLPTPAGSYYPMPVAPICGPLPPCCPVHVPVTCPPACGTTLPSPHYLIAPACGAAPCPAPAEKTQEKKSEKPAGSTEEADDGCD
jgi:hypothetical protein